ncbi:MAG: UvrD-helicase domain-containing protein [Christensenellaceae bacterium]|jgi:ATP-dependent helicase/nuclease subunit A|nr:UvrD-helicase domain-containing protein [Christensenellaceae bacterium]
MGKISWTDEQTQVFDEKTGNLLVSASAGCGKTAVMVERIFRYLNEGGEITRLIVITFTKMAATEMKEKLTDVIYSEIRRGTAKNVDHLNKQVTDIPFSFMGTIDSFCSELCRRYFDVIGSEHSFNIIDNPETSALFDKAITEIMEESFVEGDPRFLSILEYFGQGRGNELFKELISDIHTFRASQPDSKEFYRLIDENNQKSIDELPSTKYIFSYYQKRISHLLDRCYKLCSDFKILPEKINYFQNLAPHIEVLENISKAHTIAEIINAIHITLTKERNQKKGKGEDSIFTNLAEKLISLQGSIIELVTKLKGDLCLDTENITFDAVVQKERIGLETSLRVFQFADAVEERYQELKRKKSVVDYADLERFALEILSNDARSKEFADGIDALYLDEYQDTNYLQDSIIAKIAKGNVFMVGDVKQSIYNFRSADPEIFLTKKKLYHEDSEAGKNLPLNRNFRSVKPVLDFVNQVFDQIMTHDFGGIAYKEEARLVPNEFVASPDPAFPAVSIMFFEETNKSEKKSCPEIYSVKNGALVEDEIPQEGEYIVDKIVKIVGKMSIFDRKLNSNRKLRYGDISILFRKRGKDANDVIRCLNDAKIPCNTADFGDDGGRISPIRSLIAYLRLIDNYMLDVQLYAVLNSYLGGFSSSELASFQLAVNANDKNPSSSNKNNNTFFWEAVKNYDKADDLAKKRDEFFATLEKFRHLSKIMSVGKLLDVILVETGFDGYLMQHGVDGISTINAFIYQVKQNSDLDISDFLAMYDPNCDGKGEIKVNVSTGSDNSVRFYTIHKSKGLEFPVVFLAGCNQKSNKIALSKKKLILDVSLGIASVWRDLDNKLESETISMNAIKLKKRIAEKEELSRLLYVAMTRAEFALYITGTITTKKVEKVENDIEYADECETHAQLIKFASKQDEKLLKYYDLSNAEKKTAVEESILHFDTKFLDVSINWQYPHSNSVPIFSKYSVSGLYSSLQDDDALKIPHILSHQTAEKGTTYHRFMELADFNINTVTGIKEEIVKLSDKGLLSNIELLNPHLLANILHDDIFTSLNSGSSVYREKSFLLRVRADDVLPTKVTDKILVQGIVDLLIFGEENILVDYKVTELPPSDIKERYKMQMAYYVNAVERLYKMKLSKVVIIVFSPNGYYKIEESASYFKLNLSYKLESY